MQLATITARIEQILNQSDDANTANEANMHGTRSLIKTRRYQKPKAKLTPITIHNSCILKAILSLKQKLTIQK